MAENQGRHTEQSGQISDQGYVRGLEGSVNAVPGNSYPSGPDEDDADTGKVGPAINHDLIERRG